MSPDSKEYGRFLFLGVAFRAGDYFIGTSYIRLARLKFPSEKGDFFLTFPIGRRIIVWKGRRIRSAESAVGTAVGE